MNSVRERGTCPRCRCPLFKGELGAATVLGCGRCGGVWLDNVACAVVVRGAGEAYVSLGERASRQSSVSIADDGTAACPICGEILARTQAAPSAIVVDACAAHGTWFDANELRIVALAHAQLPEPMTFDPADYAPPPQDDGWSSNDDDDNGPSVSLEDIVSFVDSLLE